MTLTNEEKIKKYGFSKYYKGPFPLSNLIHFSKDRYPFYDTYPSLKVINGETGIEEECEDLKRVVLELTEDMNLYAKDPDYFNKLLEKFKSK